MNPRPRGGGENTYPRLLSTALRLDITHRKVNFMLLTSLIRASAQYGIALFVLSGFPVQAGTVQGDATAMARAQGSPCGPSSASVKQLAVIEHPDGKGFQCLGLSLADGTVSALRLETHSFEHVAGHNRMETVAVVEFPAAVVESSRGAVLDGVPGHDAIVLQGHLAPSSGTTHLITSYLYNGFTGEYRGCQITLAQPANDDWHLLNGSAQTISHIMVRTREMPVIGAFGIANLEGACS